MQTAHDPYTATQRQTMFGPPEPPRWPRTVARVFGTMGLLLISPIVLALTIGMVGSALDPSENDAASPQFYLFATLWVISGLALCTGLLVAWWREGFGALLILGGSTLLIGSTLGFALLFVFPAYAVGVLYLLSWALHRVDDAGDEAVDQISRWIRRRYYRHRIETF